MEMFEEAILPRIEEVFDKKMEEYASKTKDKLNNYRNEVVEFKVEVLGEIKDLREENQIMFKQYERTNDRVDRIAKHLDISV